MKLKIVDFETAKMLKEVGFKENTEKYYSIISAERQNRKFKESELTSAAAAICCLDNSEYCSAPTQALAQMWLREEHDIDIQILRQIKPDCYDINLMIDGQFVYLGAYETYEQALESGIKKACEILKK